MIRLFLLGNVQLTSGTGAVLEAQLRQSKRVALLGYLAVARPIGYHRRDKVAALFWPELPTDRARAALRTTLARLRDDHGAELILGRGGDEISVDGAELWCDVREFDAAILSSRFGEAVDLYRGPFLDGVHVEGAGEELETWMMDEQARLRNALLAALAAISDDAQRRGDLVAAMTAARHALDVAPNDEIVARRAIALLVASGNQGGAMQMYDELVRRLRDHLDVATAAETDALVAPLRTRRPEFVSPRSAVITENAGQQRGRLSASALAAALPGRRPIPPYGVAALALVAVMLSAGWMVVRRSAVPIAPPLAEWHLVMAIGDGAAGASGSRAVLDSTGDALLVFGGIMNRTQKLITPLGETYWRLQGLSAGDAATWTRMTPLAGAHPGPRWQFGASSDAAHDRVIIHGGALGFSSPCANDTWILKHASGIGHAPEWERVRIRGQLPPLRAAFDQVLDASRRHLIVFAGNDCFYPAYHDTWVLTFDDSTLASGTWDLVVPDTSAGFPFDRDGYTAAYDGAADRLYVHGGRAALSPTGELWALDHVTGAGGRPAWHPLLCTGDHPARIGAAGAIDVESDSWTFFGGLDASSQPTQSVWRVYGLLRDIGNCRWQQLLMSGPSPAARGGASAARLPGSRGMVIFGGAFQNNALSDAWVLKPTVKP